MNTEFRLMVMTPRCFGDPALAIAGSRAGALGILDLGALGDPETATKALADLVRLGGPDIGVRIEVNGDTDALVELVSGLPAGSGVVVVAPALGGEFGDALQGVVSSLRKEGHVVLAEVSSLEEASRAVASEVDGLIAKGNEAGGRVEEETTFVLLQRLLERIGLPIWARGAIGMHTAAACAAAGAAGIVLADELALVRESTLPADVRKAITAMDGGETTVLGAELGRGIRFFLRPGSLGCETLKRRHDEFRVASDREGWHEFLVSAAESAAGPIGWRPDQAWLLGQDACFATQLAERFRTTGGVVSGLLANIDEHLHIAREEKPLAPDSALARAHGTRFPIVQGPMTRVSDLAPFAAEVAKAGGLPFIALALLRADETEEILSQTQQALGNRPWGVGILGFVPRELREEQLGVVRRIRPKFALIAGGRPDQALQLEAEGITSYLHVPSPTLLDQYLEQGARRFVFEGRECGGHVGPRSSFVLWNQMVSVLLERAGNKGLDDCHVLFAGGIHDARSAAMVSALAAPLAARGTKIGALMGTAYLFTEEAVATGAIVAGFQKTAVACERTTLLETGPGHATRCAITPFANHFLSEKGRLQAEGRPHDEMRNELESLNLGKLRVAAKGVDRNLQHTVDTSQPKLTVIDEEQQAQDGMYMIGQVAGLRDRVLTMAELHEEVSVGSVAQLDSTGTVCSAPIDPPGPRLDVAIVGMSCLLPGAADHATFWDNILNSVETIGEVPPERWDWRRYFDEDQSARDKVYSRWGGFLAEVPFDPLAYGMPPTTLQSIDPLQLLTLEVVRAALADAGVFDREFPLQKASIILGAGGGVADLGNSYAVRAALPALFDNLPDQVWDRLPEWTEDSFAGLLLNVAAGRAANRFDFGGINLTVDAACASSLGAIYFAAQELADHRSDLVLAGGVDTAQNPFGYLCFSKTHALSPRGKSRVFDATADGIVISEGLAVVVLKRLVDAERDGDRIYAVLRGVGGSSDGRGRSMTAPRPGGQMRALDRAYRQAGYSPATVELFEAHGTGTAAGDMAEAETLTRVLEAAGARSSSAAVGSVKSMIGHTKCAAGVTGVIKTALALHRKVLPPTINVDLPNPKAKFGEGPLYVNSELRPWLRSATDHPRRAGVSAFGFGGTNFHVTLEEYTGDPPSLPKSATARSWPAELLLFKGNKADVIARIERLAADLESGARPRLRDLSASCWESASRACSGITAALIASDPATLADRLTRLQKSIVDDTELDDPAGAWYTPQPLADEGDLAVAFPGQGSQYPDMFRDLAIHFREVREEIECAERTLADAFDLPLGAYLYPPPAFSPEEKQRRADALRDTRVAQPALGAVERGGLRLLAALGVVPDMVAGHSYGEYAALSAAGVIDSEELARVSEARGRWIVEAATRDLGTMAAVKADGDATAAAIAGLDDVWIANYNSPLQTVISGTTEAIEDAISRLKDRDIEARQIPVSCGFHSPLVAPARDRLAEILTSMPIAAPKLPVYSNATADRYPEDPQAVKDLLSDHLVTPVRFADEITAMYDAGARVFLEVGPKAVLTGLSKQILEGRPHLSLSLDRPGRSGLLQLLHVLGALAAHGVPLDLAPLFEGRDAKILDLARLPEETREAPLPPSTWMVNGGGVRPLNQEVVRPTPISLPTAGQSAAPTHEMSPTSNDHRAVTADQSRAQGPASSAIGSGAVAQDADRVIHEFQKSMNQLIESQERVMLAYLGAAPDEAADRSARPGIQVETPQDVAPGHAPIPAAPSPVEAAQTPPSLEDTGASLPSPETAKELPDETELRTRLIEIVVARTGYPADLVDPDASLEADLGIDSIKRVEILGELQRSLPDGLESHLQGIMEELTAAQTLSEISDRLARALTTAEDLTAPTATSTDTKAEAPGTVVTLTASEIAESLLAIVVARTGYPADLVDPDASLEADLGIDSIKRVEILGELQRSLPDGLESHLQGIMEELTAAQSLAEIADRIAMALAATAGPEPGIPDEEQPTVSDAPMTSPRLPATEGLPRFAMRAVAADSPVPEALPDGIVLITEDSRGVASALAATLNEHGVETRLVDGFVAASGIGSPTLTEALAAADRVAGVVYLSALTADPIFPGPSFDAWREQLHRETKGLFDLAQLAVKSVSSGSNGRGRPRIVATTALGGDFALGDRSDGEEFTPGHGGICGLAKTFAVERPELGVKVVDLDLRETNESLAENLLAEILADDGEVEVGWRDGLRWVPRPVAAPAEPGLNDILDQNSVVLLTGGARGITAEIAVELAETFSSTVVLVGRSPKPGDEEEATASISGDRELKAALIAGRRQRGLSVRLPEVEADFRRVMADREIRNTLKRLEVAGSKWVYYEADVCNPDDLTRVLSAVQEKFGRLDAVIHGAGRIEDKLLADKDWKSFERVFETKALSAYLLARDLTPFLKTLKFVAFFSSVAGAFPNRGQADYTAGNEVMNKLAIMIANTWSDSPCRVVALNWGPWEKGMANEAVQSQFQSRGIEPISVPDGRAALLRELTSVSSDPVVVLGRGPWEAPPDHRKERHHETSAIHGGETAQPEGGTDRPLLSGSDHRTAPSGFSIERVLDPTIDVYLDDHRLDGCPVLPMAAALEMMVELAELGWPPLSVNEVRELSVFKGIALPDDAEQLKTVRLDARVVSGSELDVLVVRIEVRDADLPEMLHYRATVELSRKVEHLGGYQSAAVEKDYPLSIADAYQKYLFHGPRFAHIERIEGTTSSGLLAQIRPSDPSAFINGGNGAWLIDPVVFDSGLQLVLLWTRNEFDVTPLPARFARYRRFGPLRATNGGPIFCELVARPQAGVAMVHADLTFFEQDGNVLGILEGLECPASRELNRLAGTASPLGAVDTGA